MKKTILSLLLLAGFTCGTYAQGTEDPDVKYTKGLLSVGTQAPDFVLKKAKADQPALSLSDYRTHKEGDLNRPGCYVLLDFWATWCPDCRKEIPAVKEIFQQYKNKVKLIGVSFDTDKEQLKSFREKNEIKWTMYSEYKKWKETNISKAYNIQWIPTMYLIDPEGKVAYTTVVAENMKKKLAELDAAGKLTEYVKKASFPGGNKAFGKQIATIVKYPAIAQKYNANAKVKLQFMVDEKGNLSDITIKDYQGQPLSGAEYQKLSPSEQQDAEVQVKTLLSQEAIRALTQISETTKWEPAQERGKAIKCRYSQTITFKR